MLTISTFLRAPVFSLRKKQYKYSESYLSVDYSNIAESYYLNLFKDLETKHKIFTFNTVHFFSIYRIRQISMPWLYLKFGMPIRSFSISKSNIKIKILLYKMYLGDNKVKVEFHFHKRKLVFYKYIFQNMNDKKKKKLIDSLAIKYTEGQSFNPNDTYISDSKNTIISFYDSYEFEVQYLPSLNFIDLVRKNQKQNKKAEKLRKLKQRDKLFDKL